MERSGYGAMSYHSKISKRLHASACVLHRNRWMKVSRPKRLSAARNTQHTVCFSLFLLIFGSSSFGIDAQPSEFLLEQYQHAEFLANQGQYDAALTEYQRVLHQNPESAEAYGGIGYVYWKTNKPDQALKAFRKALAVNDRILKAHVGIGHVLSERREHQEAIAHYEMALEINPELGWLHSTLADLLSRQRRESDAIRHYQTAIELNPNLSQAHFGLGNIYVTQVEFSSALEAYNCALALQPNLSEAHCNRGVVYSKQGRYEEAIADFQQALRIAPDNRLARLGLGFAYQQQGKYNVAAQEYEKILLDSADNLRLHHNLSRCYLRLGRPEEAWKEREIARRLRQVADAIDVAERKIQEAPDDPHAYMELAGIYFENNQPDKAFDQYKIALLKDPNLLEAYDKIASGLYQSQSATGGDFSLRNCGWSRRKIYQRTFNARVALSPAWSIEKIGSTPRNRSKTYSRSC